ncbi:dienelactone hydrolase family protein [Azohydromonas sediminis]|uniref:dienelactone hydrolase family protein n=1 Tax=Azohydromonas sediminis TaxID=2259674 RepID=UPI000E64A413|nr:dienelactone hydrolase family protein [Azohydromonas sediminis]
MDLPANAERYIEDKRPFAAHVGIYPFCSIYLPRRTVYSPLLILGGSADTWTPIGNCKDLFERSRVPNVTIIEYDGATHAWDAPYPTRTVAGTFGPVVLAYDASATQDGIRHSMAFIERHLRF